MLAEPTFLFLKSILLGAVLSLYYDIFYALRIIFPGKWQVHIPLDILYFLLSGAVIFHYVLYENMGQIRSFILLGLLLGWVLWHLTLSRLLVGIFTAILHFIKRLIRKLIAPPVNAINKLFKKAGESTKKKKALRRKKREERKRMKNKKPKTRTAPSGEGRGDASAG